MNGRVSVHPITGSPVHTVHVPLHLLVRAFGLAESGGRKPMRKKDPGRDPVLRRIVRALREYGAERIILFGSRARGDALPDGDYDVIVYTPEEWEVVGDRLAGRAGPV
jgi:hypothetical protein